MQRDRTDHLSIKNIIFAILMVFYEILSGAFYYLPPLIGLFFTYLVILKNESERTISKLDRRWYMSFCFVVFAEQIHGFILFSSVLGFIFIYYMFSDWLRINMKYRWFLLVIFVFSGYAGTLGFGNLFLYIFNEKLLQFSYEYIIFIAIESIICIVLFGKKVL